MSEFSKSNWAKPEFSKGYRDKADVFIVDRRRADVDRYYRNGIFALFGGRRPR
jgi:hypothetical protein